MSPSNWIRGFSFLLEWGRRKLYFIVCVPRLLDNHAPRQMLVQILEQLLRGSRTVGQFELLQVTQLDETRQTARGQQGTAWRRGKEKNGSVTLAFLIGTLAEETHRRGTEPEGCASSTGVAGQSHALESTSARTMRKGTTSSRCSQLRCPWCGRTCGETERTEEGVKEADEEYSRTFPSLNNWIEIYSIKFDFRKYSNFVSISTPSSWY